MWRSTGRPDILREKSQDYTWRQDLYGRTHPPTPAYPSRDHKDFKLPPIREPMSVQPTTNATYGSNYNWGRVSLNYLPRIVKNREISQYRRHLLKASDEYGEFWTKYIVKDDGDVQVRYSLPDEQLMLKKRLQQPPFLRSPRHEGLVLREGKWQPVYYN